MAESLTTTVELALGADLTADPATWGWTDASGYVTGSASITQGRSDADSNTKACTLRLTVDNTDGRFSRLNPSGAWFGQLQRNTPIRATVSWDVGQESQRFAGYISELPPRWAPGLNDQWVDLVANGVIRRLEKSDAITSPLKQHLTTMTPTPAGYWPLEDPEGSTHAASAIDGVAEMRQVSVAAKGNSGKPIDFGTIEGPPGGGIAPSLPLAFTSLRGSAVVSDSAWSVAFWVLLSAPDGAASRDILRVDCDGDIPWWNIKVNDSQVTLSALDLNGTSHQFAQLNFLEEWTQPYNGQWHFVAFTAAQSGADVAFELWWDGQSSASTAVTDTLVRPRQIQLPDGGMFVTTITEHSSAHLALWDGVLTDQQIADIRTAGLGHVGETAADRVARVCATADIPVTVVEGPDDSEAMGPQPMVTPLEILRDVEDADGGVLHETLDGKIRYLTRSGRYEAAAGTPVLEIGAGQALIIQAADDDQELTNDYTATRTGGLSAQYVDQASVDAEGRYDDAASVNIASDDRVLDHAGWQVHLGTVEEYRWPQVQFDLAAHPELIDQWVACEVGSRVQIADILPNLPPGLIDLVVEGWTETWTSLTWTVTLNLSPASPYQVGEVGDSTLGRLDTAGSVLQAAIDADDTALVVATTDGPPWITTASHSSEFPFDINLAGEQATVTAIGSGVTDDYARTVAAGDWGSTADGRAWSIQSTPSDFSVNGSRGLIDITTASSRNVTLDVDVANADFAATIRVPQLVTGAAVFVGVSARRVTSSDFYMSEIVVNTNQTLQVRLRKSDGGSFSTLVTSGTIIGLTHTATLDMRVRLSIDGGVLRTRVWDAAGTEPSHWHAVVVDDSVEGLGDIGCRAQISGGTTNALPFQVQYDDFTASDPQLFTVTRSVNGVSKSHAAGTAVNLWTPLEVAL